MAIERVRLTSRDGIGVIAIDNPPVNALGVAVIADLVARIAEVESRADLRGAVLHGAGGTFSGGADIREFGSQPAPGPTLRDAIAAIERSSKPFVAALEGNALGGGLELALACDHRVARPGTRLGQPEIKLGLIPGAGGSQRLPRLVGVLAAAEMIVGGNPVAAERARELGLVDALADGELLAAAIAMLPEPGSPRRRASAQAAAGTSAELDALRTKIERPERGGLAAGYALDAVACALAEPFASGLARERELFDELRASEQSKARIHLFYAERRAAKGGDLPASAFRARTAAVVGAGTMGSGIAMTLADAGIAVTLIDLQPEALARARGVIAGNYDTSMRRGRFTQADVDQRLARIGYATELESAADADLVIEAVFEELDVKRDVFAKLDRIARSDAVLTTNTSTLDVDAIAAATGRPQAIAGTHFFSPANVMKLLEIVRGTNTAPQAVAQALALAKQLKKIPVVAGNCDGFIGNRMFAHYKREADFLLEEGAHPQQVDRVIRDFGFPMGPFATFDLTGLDISWAVRKRRLAEQRLSGRYSKLEDRLCELGRFGQKTGAGFYRYEPGSRTPIPDPYVDDVIGEVARQAGITRRDISDEEILERCIYALINEAAAILADGTAARPGDVDVVWVYGYGFPAFRGGPLRYADAIGLRPIYDAMLALERVHGAAWTPTPLFAQLATGGGSFATWKGGT